MSIKGVPIIRYADGYECCDCGQIHSPKDWDAATRTHYGEEIIQINDAWHQDHMAVFVCPFCGSSSELSLLELGTYSELHYIQPKNNKEAASLLTER